MINIDDRFITEVMPKIGAKSTSVLLAICKHLDVNKTAFPSKLTLRKYTGLGRDAMDECLKKLADNKIITKKQRRRENGKHSSNIYIVTCEYIKVYIPAKVEFENKPHTEKPHTEKPHTEKPLTVFPNTDKPTTENPPLSINQYIEVLTNSNISINNILEDCLVSKEKISLLDLFKIQSSNDQIFTESIYKEFKRRSIDFSELENLQDRFISEKLIKEEIFIETTFSDLKTHFWYWLPIQLNKIQTSKNKSKSNKKIKNKTDSYKEIDYKNPVGNTGVKIF